MILINTDSLPFLYIDIRDSEWVKQDYDNAMGYLETLLRDSIEKQQRLQILIAGTTNTVTPPMWVFTWVIRDIMRMYPLFPDGIEHTGVYAPSSKLNKFFEMLFKVYTPVRPLRMFKNYDQAYNWVRRIES
jgi:hypothetical protein